VSRVRTAARIGVDRVPVDRGPDPLALPRVEIVRLPEAAVRESAARVRVLRVARTIADLAGEARTREAAVAEALGCRADAGPRTRRHGRSSGN
jgi:predicted ATPase with chaperone activity